MPRPGETPQSRERRPKRGSEPDGREPFRVNKRTASKAEKGKREVDQPSSSLPSKATIEQVLR